MKKSPLFVLSILSICLMIACKSSHVTPTYIDNTTIQNTIDQIAKSTKLEQDLIVRGVRGTAGLWTKEDGSKEEFTAFCLKNFCANQEEKELLFTRISTHLETIFGHHNRISIELLRPLHVTGYETLPIDEQFGAYDGLSHFGEDMFSNKIAFVITLNFPFYSLEEKNQHSDNWSELEWGYARLGDLFTDRVPAQYLQEINNATAAADHYISNYNIHMGMLVNEKMDTLFPKEMKLISHWGLRDELKSNYADKANGLRKQELIYSVMQRIIDQTIPTEVIDKNSYIWEPVSNKLYLNHQVQKSTPEENNRYHHLLNIYKAMKAADKYYYTYPTYISRKFDEEFEISQKETEALFKELVSSPQVKKVGALIEQRLGRKLRPFDIWYDGFKGRSEIAPEQLDRIVSTKYPTKETFAADLPNILIKLGFTKEIAAFITDHVTVDASVGAGHAWESKMKSDNAMLRTRIGENGMDYKGYNIGVHEFGHNVEQTISLHNVPNYMLAGVPNTAFTEALAFIFQSKDLELLGLTQEDKTSEYLNTLDIFWSCYEIMGVSLLDMKVWQWMYDHPNATANDLKEAVIELSKEIWNEYYAPVFGIKDQTILAIYSHSIDAPLYLSAYPLGYLIHYQLNNHFKGKDFGTEVARIFALGRLTPQFWLKKAVGSELSCTPLLQATDQAVEQLSK